jgi:hypothetical protein
MDSWPTAHKACSQKDGLLTGLMIEVLSRKCCSKKLMLKVVIGYEKTCKLCVHIKTIIMNVQAVAS